MNGNKSGLLDSNVIIDGAKGLISMDKIINDYDFLFTSIINYVEVLGYNFENEEERDSILEIIDKIPIIELDTNIADIAIEYRKKKKIKLPDALFAATAKKIKADILTRNLDDFKNLDEELTIIEPEVM